MAPTPLTSAPTTVIPQRPPQVIRGTLLRSVLLLALDRAGGSTLGVPELCAALTTLGFTVPGRIGKVVSDALRCERARGRVIRSGRGRYRIGQLPRTTRWRCHQRVLAAQRGAAPPSHLHRLGGPGARRASTVPVMPARGVEALRQPLASDQALRRARHRYWSEVWKTAGRSVDAPLPPEPVVREEGHTPTDAAPTDAAPTDAAPTDAAPTDAAPTDAARTDVVAESRNGGGRCRRPSPGTPMRGGLVSRGLARAP